MENQLPEAWERALGPLEFAFQPIVSFADGSAYGYEALLRGWERAGFSSIAEVFDRACEARVLYALDLELRRKAFSAFSALCPGRAKIFYNVDNRLLGMPDYATGNTLRIARETGLAPSRIVFELSELHEPGSDRNFDRILSSYRDQGFRIALDDFGTGYAGLKLLYRAQPDIVKIDRFFVGGAAEDPRKASFLTKIAGLAHLMGISVVAEGIETEVELRLCADAGCDLAQGYLLARPRVDASALPRFYPAAQAAASRRSAARAGKVGADNAVRAEPVALGTPLVEILDRFRRDPDASIVPVVDAAGESAGIYRERDFRPYVYSPYGISLLEHLAAGEGAEALLVKAPTVPIGAGLGRIVEIFGTNAECGGVVLTDAGRYAGILPAKELLGLVAEMELAEARDQNPLSRLPGNLRVSEVCAERLAEPGGGTAFAYFDFDNFKPFNDHYGFRSGDRVIILFADILKSAFPVPSGFVGHLGGDDFFACFEASGAAAAEGPLAEIRARFAREASSFYTPEDRDRGWILGVDRSGVERRMPLLGVSAAAVLILPGTRLDAEALSELLAELKREAKASDEGLALRVVVPEPPRGSAGASRESAEENLAKARAASPFFTAALLASC